VVLKETAARRALCPAWQVAAPWDLALRWSVLRVGYFWGGDGECVLKVDAEDLAATLRLPEAEARTPPHSKHLATASQPLPGGGVAGRTQHDWRARDRVPREHTRLDAPRLITRRVAACPAQAALQDLAAPFRAAVDVRWHAPKDASAEAHTRVSVDVGDLRLQPSFLHVPGLQAAADHFAASWRLWQAVSKRLRHSQMHNAFCAVQ
jgi:hypothetical protein